MELPVICFTVANRSEAISVSPVVKALRKDGRFGSRLVSCGEDRLDIEETLAWFDLAPDVVLNTTSESATVATHSSHLMPLLSAELVGSRASACVVTGNSMAAALSALIAFWHGIPVVGIDSGTRIGGPRTSADGHRRISDQICTRHLAATAHSAANLIREGVSSDSIVVTGKTTVDAIGDIASRDLPYQNPKLTDVENSGRRIVLLALDDQSIPVRALRRILEAARHMTLEDTTVHLVVPSHGKLRDVVNSGLAGVHRVLICDELTYPDRARLLANASLVITNSGEILEEAPTFDVPVLVPDDIAARPEAVLTGVARLVGTDSGTILSQAQHVLSGVAEWNTTGYIENPFGDGRAGQRSLEAIGWNLGLNDRPEDFQPDSANKVLRRPLLYRVA